MAHRADKGSDPPHVHDYRLKNTKYKWANAYEFWECVNHKGTCKKRDKMVIRRRRKGE